MGNGNSVILGDNGNATFAIALASGSVAAGDAIYSRTLDANRDDRAGGQRHPNVGSDRRRHRLWRRRHDQVGAGNNVIIGGLGADQITTGDGNNIILGDSGTADFTATGVITTIFSTFVGAPVGGTPDTGTSSDDTITTGTGNNIIFGGSGADTITADSDTPGTIQTSTGLFNDIILGDDGEPILPPAC